MKGSLLASDHSDKTRLLLEAALKGINKTQKKKKKKAGLWHAADGLYYKELKNM